MSRELAWKEFCAWVQGKRVARTDEPDLGTTVLTFGDGSVATLRSTRTYGSPGYSEVTPGSDGHLTPPTVTIEEGGEYYG